MARKAIIGVRPKNSPRQFQQGDPVVMVQQDFWDNIAGKTGVVISSQDDLFVNVRFEDGMTRRIEYHNLKKLGKLGPGVVA